MNASRHAAGQGLRRGWTEFVQSVRSPQDQGFYLFTGLVTLAVLWFNRDNEVGSTGLMYPTYALPSVLGALLTFGVVIGPAYALAMEREDGTLLRHKAVPHGMQGYVTGQLTFQSLSLAPGLLVVLVPSLLLFDDVMQGGAGGWLAVAGLVVIGLLATLPWGMVLGSVVPGVQKVGTWGMLPVLVLVAISGVFTPVQAMWGWVQAVAQVFPVYWIALGMRSAFLPAEAAVAELGDSWRTGTMLVVLSAWAVAGLLVAPRVLRRMARRQSGSAVQAAREAALQWVR
ncbi:ABC-type multidrug transport system, permease component [Modestobacter italicus]|uniref:ABC-type multidrug transport system, permease component n=1 Tax=Modestobacter italicus (strain DSM 44449 / CECT 9708 / BC 501) TaxID=2732864 RepID=I4ERQ9_MODI5|nr:ABC transporter permease [Modestobacter marinus]CCH86072.1 ABC-type multidrug transport system, permease component [Modestobacter marinus]